MILESWSCSYTYTSILLPTSVSPGRSLHGSVPVTTSELRHLAGHCNSGSAPSPGNYRTVEQKLWFRRSLCWDHSWPVCQAKWQQRDMDQMCDVMVLRLWSMVLFPCAHIRFTLSVCLCIHFNLTVCSRSSESRVWPKHGNCVCPQNFYFVHEYNSFIIRSL